MSNQLMRLLKNQSGATSIEYALIAAGVSIVIVTVVTGIGVSVNSMFTSVAAGVK